MAEYARPAVPLAHLDRFYIGGEWVEPSRSSQIDVFDSATEEFYFAVPEAQAADMDRAVAAAREAFDAGPWPRMPPGERAEYLRALGEFLGGRGDVLGEIWPRESGALQSLAHSVAPYVQMLYGQFADLTATYPFEEVVPPTTGGEFGLVVSEPIGVVGAIIPWNSPIGTIAVKTAPALLAGCTIVVKSSPEAPGEGYLLAEAAEAVGLPPGVINVVTADREVSERLVTDPRVDKITFTGSTVTGRRIAALCSERMARFTLELGGKSAALVLDDADLAAVAAVIAKAECSLSGQVCTSLTRVIISRERHDEMAQALAEIFSRVRVGSPFDPESQMGPLASREQRERVEGYVAKGLAEGATLVSGGGRPAGLDRGWYVEPTVFSDVDNQSTIAQEEIFGPVLCVISADGDDHAVELANDTIYGLNASVFTSDADRAYEIARRLQSGTVGHNAPRTDMGMSFGGFKQSGIGREGLRGGVDAFVETKSVILDSAPRHHQSSD